MCARSSTKLSPSVQTRLTVPRPRVSAARLATLPSQSVVAARPSGVRARSGSRCAALFAPDLCSARQSTRCPTPAAADPPKQPRSRHGTGAAYALLALHLRPPLHLRLLIRSLWPAGEPRRDRAAGRGARGRRPGDVAAPLDDLGRDDRGERAGWGWARDDGAERAGCAAAAVRRAGQARLRCRAVHPQHGPTAGWTVRPRLALRPDARSDEPFLSFSTSTYKLHYYETPTSLRFVMLTDPTAGPMRNALRSLYAGPYIEHVVRNPGPLRPRLPRSSSQHSRAWTPTSAAGASTAMGFAARSKLSRAT